MHTQERSNIPNEKKTNIDLGTQFGSKLSNCFVQNSMKQSQSERPFPGKPEAQQLRDILSLWYTVLTQL